MAYAVYLKKSAEKEMEKFPENIHDRIIKRILLLKTNPGPAGIVKLTIREAYRMRVGDYRILYTINDSRKIVEIISVGHRRKVYLIK